MMKTKLFCTDLDDTLLRKDKSIPEDNIKAIREMTEAGHLFAIVTGRSINGGRMVFDQLGIGTHNCYLASFHGNVLYDLEAEKILLSNGMDQDFTIRLLKECKKAGIYAQTYTTESVLIPEDCETSRKFLAITKERYELIGDYERLRNLTLPKVIVIDNDHPERLPVFQKEFMPVEEGRANSFFSCPQYLEYCDYGYDKGVGLTNLARVLGVDIADVVAVGDERNDTPMIRVAGTGCAMINGHDEAKDAADYITEKDNENSGVAEVIKKFIL